MNDWSHWLERYRLGLAAVAAAAADLAEPELDYRSAPGRWSVRQILGHLADSECVAVDRFRRVIAEPNPTILWYDEQAWATHLDYAQREPSRALATFRQVREDTLALLEALPAEAAARTGVHSKNGPFTLLDLLKMYAEHAEGHARQIGEARRAYRQTV